MVYSYIRQEHPSADSRQMKDQEANASELHATGVLPNDFQAKSLGLSGRVIMAVTCLPNQIYQDEGSWKTRHLHGNSAIYSSFYYLDQKTEWETHLVGWTGKISAENPLSDLKLTEAEKLDITNQLKEANGSQNVHPVWLLRKDQDRWTRYADEVIWKIFHYIQNPLPSSVTEEDEMWKDYVKFNEAYASKILEAYKPGDIVWIHDFYLLLLPQLLTMRNPDIHVGLYLHTPFPSSEYFRCLPRRVALLDGMLGATRIVFQGNLFKKHFISSCTRILGCEAGDDHVSFYGGSTKVEALPTGIDTLKIVEDAFQESIDEKVESMRKLYAGKKIIVGRDRLDSVRGVVQKLQAFERFLAMYPEWRDQVVLVQVSSPVLGSVQYAKEVAELVAYINGTYGTLNSTPVRHFQMRLEKSEYLALLRVADVGLITTVRDGMNTTALEFVACQKHNASPLILSEFSGTTTVLNDAILVNPWDAVGVARTLNECLLMNEASKQALEKKLYDLVATNTVQYSCNKFLTHFVDDLGQSHESHSTPSLDRPALLSHYKKSNKRLFLFDYDGTLTPIVKDPEAAVPSQRLLRILEKLSNDPKNEIWIISGRDQRFLTKWLGSKNAKLGLSAEHGCFVKETGAKDWVNLAEATDMRWQKDVEEIFRYYTERTPGSFIERKKVALTWHYRKADPEYGEFQAKELKQHLTSMVAVNYDVEVMSGKANIEVRPKFVNKGEIVRRLVIYGTGTIDEHSVPHKVHELADFIFCIGDDKTDEDMFEALLLIEEQWEKLLKEKNAFGNHGIYPITVGPASKQTIAKAHLLEPQQVLDTLGLLVDEVSLFETGGNVKIDDRGHAVL